MYLQFLNIAFYSLNYNSRQPNSKQIPNTNYISLLLLPLYLNLHKFRMRPHLRKYYKNISYLNKKKRRILWGKKCYDIIDRLTIIVFVAKLCEIIQKYRKTVTRS